MGNSSKNITSFSSQLRLLPRFFRTTVFWINEESLVYLIVFALDVRCFFNLEGQFLIDHGLEYLPSITSG